MTTAEPATEVRAIPTYIAIPASKVLGEVFLSVEGVVLEASATTHTPATCSAVAPEGTSV